MKPEGFIDKQTQTSNQLDSCPVVLVDDTSYTVDSVLACVGSVVVISGNIPIGMIKTNRNQ